MISISEAVPKRILELMNVPGLTRENVASHLQVWFSPTFFFLICNKKRKEKVVLLIHIHTHTHIYIYIGKLKFH